MSKVIVRYGIIAGLIVGMPMMLYMISHTRGRAEPRPACC